VIAACYEADLIPEDGDFRAKGERLLRQYLWSSFFTDRYENSAASRAYADFKALRTLLQTKNFTDANLASVPVLNRTEWPLATEDSLLAAGWPKAAGIRARAITAVTTYFGAIDFADHQPASYQSLQRREYHHVFPDALLEEAGLPSFLALNCALITWKTNRNIGRKDPLLYLQERVQLASEDIVDSRLRSHLISFDRLAKARYADASGSPLTGEALKAKLQADFDAFLRERARLVAKAMSALTVGDEPTLESLWTSEAAGVAVSTE
jgi:hypothetical protein